MLPSPSVRVDLSNRTITILAGVLVLAVAGALLLPELPTPGSVLGQTIGAIGGVALLAPLLFFAVKRTGATDSPPRWFVVHVLSSIAGVALIAIHCAEGHWFSPPGILLLVLFILTVQGLLMRGVLASQFSRLFARTSARGGFTHPLHHVDKSALQFVIERKRDLLAKLDGSAEEALFSPTLQHWLRRPLLSCQYAKLAAQETSLIGARAAAGTLLCWSRRMHMILAAIFLAGLLLHVVLVLFFAGYVAGDREITWWHLAAWGR